MAYGKFDEDYYNRLLGLTKDLPTFSINTPKRENNAYELAKELAESRKMEMRSSTPESTTELVETEEIPTTQQEINEEIVEAPIPRPAIERVGAESSEVLRQPSEVSDSEIDPYQEKRTSLVDEYKNLLAQLGQEKPEIQETQEVDPAYQKALEERDRLQKSSMLLSGFQDLIKGATGYQPSYKTAQALAAKGQQAVTDYEKQRQAKKEDRKEKKEARKEERDNIAFKMKLKKLDLQMLTDEEANDPNSQVSKIIQDRVIQRQKEMGQPVNEAHVRSLSGEALAKRVSYVAEDFSLAVKEQKLEKQQALEREKIQADKEAETIKAQAKEDKELRKIEQKEKKEKNKQEKEFKKESMAVFNIMKKDPVYAQADKILSGAKTIEMLLEDAYKKGGQSLAMLGPQVAKKIAGEVGVLTQLDVTRYVNHPAWLQGGIDAYHKFKDGKLSEVSYENLKRLMEISKDAANKEKNTIIERESNLWSRRSRGELSPKEARYYLDSDFIPTVKIQAPDGTVQSVKKDSVQKYLDKGGKIVE